MENMYKNKTKQKTSIKRSIASEYFIICLVVLHTYNTLFINLSMNVRKMLKLNKYVSLLNDV